MKTRDLPVFPISSMPVRPGVSPEAQPVTVSHGAVGPEDGVRIGLLTLGCDKNTVDSERLMATLVGHGARVSGDLEDAEVVIVNTCGFIEAAKAQSIEAILDACRLKEEGRLKAVAAVGCMVQRYKDDLEREIPEVDLFLGLTELDTLIPELRQRKILGPARVDLPVMERPLRILSSETPHTSFLKISEGCDHTCAFCAIPLMRGLHRSHPLEELVREARTLGEAGVRELNIISQDTTWYGRDLKRKREIDDAPLLPQLLRALVRETSVDWYRLFYMYPSGLTRELVDFMATEPRVLPYLDMPIQHGSDRMLTRMRRPERQASIRERVAWLREAIPDLTLRTTVIVGFPQESDEDFEQMLEFLEEVQFDRVGAFAYSTEEGTRAAEMEGHLPESLKSERLERLLDLQRGISMERNHRHLNTVQTILIDEPIENDAEFSAVGRAPSQAFEVDGVTHLVRHDGIPIEPGSFLSARIVDASEYDLVAEIVSDPVGAIAEPGGGRA